MHTGSSKSAAGAAQAEVAVCLCGGNSGHGFDLLKMMSDVSLVEFLNKTKYSPLLICMILDS